jgi:hypothetical protein
MTSSDRQYRQVALGADLPDAVTVGVERVDAPHAAAVWWPSRGDIDPDEAEYDSVEAALDAAEAARVLHGFSEVVVTLAVGADWQAEWGQLVAREPIGDLRGTDLSSEEAYSLASGIEHERDA